jgi:AAA15 family ATPase/GTPase
MLKSFSVTGFKGFRDTCTIDFSKVRDYDFNQNLIKNGLVNKVLLYGKNGSGKSNLGFAIMDITTHLTDNQRDPTNYLFSLNGDCAFKVISFRYVFQFGQDEVTYEYEKDEMMVLLTEKILVNQNLVFSYDYKTNTMDNRLPEISNYNAQTLLRRNLNNSVIKTIYGFSAHLPDNSPIKLIYEFANGMLWFRSLGAYEYMGKTNIIENVDQYIASDPVKLKTFESFLGKFGLHYSLIPVSDVSGQHIYVKFANSSLPFFPIVSTGTRSLCLFFYWMDKMKDKITFLYLDEYDAFYHFNLAQSVLRIVNDDKSYQSIVTTHNPYLADNAIMRPDCYMNLKDGKIKSFADSTNRVIRQGNSLEKMVLSDDL